MGTLICRIELNKNKENGITISVENKDESITHTVQMDGKQIEIKSTDGSNTSVITQKPQSIEHKVGDDCTIFQDKENVKINCKNFKLEADDISCKSSKNTSMESGQKFSIKSTADTEINASQNFKTSSSMDTTLTASTNFKASGSINANLEGNITTVKGSVCNVQGSLVKLG